MFALGERADGLRPLLWGLAAGVMAVASVVGLLAPALDEGSGLRGRRRACSPGIVFLLGGRRALAGRDVHVGVLRGAGVRRSVLVFGVLLVHSLPEGFAIGTAFASEREGLGVFVLLAIALQNIPEGTASAIPMRDAGFSPSQQFWAAVATSAPQPVGAVAHSCSSSRSGPAAGLVRVRGRGDARARRARARAAGLHAHGPGGSALAGAAGGAALMLALSAVIGV